VPNSIQHHLATSKLNPGKNILYTHQLEMVRNGRDDGDVVVMQSRDSVHKFPIYIAPGQMMPIDRQKKVTNSAGRDQKHAGRW
jgi:hypothetical protein